MESSEFCAFNFAGAALVVDKQHPPQLGAIEVLAIDETLEGPANTDLHMADKECPQGGRDPGHVNVHPRQVHIVVQEVEGQRKLACLDLVSNTPIALVGSYEMVTE